MMTTWLRTGGKAAWVAVLSLGLGGSAGAGTVHVYANNEVTGDNFQGGQGFFGPTAKNQGLTNPANLSGWYYSEVTGKDSFIGVNGNLPHDGNGSVYLQGGSKTSKADIAFRPGGVLGLLSELTTLSYDYIRTGGNAPAHYAPAIRVKVTAGSKTGYLVWEPVYNGHPTNNPIDLNTWYTGDAIGGKFWATNALYSNGVNTYKSLSDWVLALGSNARITEVNVGIGSGWAGSFTGATDNIAFGFNGNSTTYMFDVSPSAAVPEPGSIALGLIAGGAGLAAAAWRRRRTG